MLHDREVDVDSNKTETVIENDRLYPRGRQPTYSNIQISKALGENEKWVFYRKKQMEFWGNPIIIHTYYKIYYNTIIFMYFSIFYVICNAYCKF